MSDDERLNREGQRRRIFYLQIAYAVGLVGVVVAASSWRGWRPYLPDPLGPVPLAVPWFGALGGVLISMRGVFEHARDWDGRYVLRHVARPLTAAVSGTVGYLILIGGVVAVGQTPATGADSLRSAVIYDVTAFAIGYREEVFRTLLRRTIDRLLGRRPDNSS